MSSGKVIMLLIVLAAGLSVTHAQTFVPVAYNGKVPAEIDTFPVPPSSNRLLFYIQRTPNTNTIVYELNDKNGKLDKENPIHPLWIRYQEDGRREELSYIQRNYAYGIKVKPITDSHYEFSFVSYKKYKLYLEQSANDKNYYVYTVKDNKKIKLNRVFLKITGGSFWLPKIEYVELKGIDLLTGKEIVDRFKP